jgi:DNA-binding MarR family transcriptional regulator
MIRKKDVSGLEDHLGYWLRFVSNHVSQVFATRIAELGVSVVEWIVLRELFDGPQSPSALAERLGITRGGLSKLADRLTDRLLVIRTPSHKDRRFQDMALTDAGRTLVPALAAIADRNDAEFFSSLAPADRVKLKQMMRDIVRLRGLRTTPIE